MMLVTSLREKFSNWLAYRLPVRVAYHAAVRVHVHGTVGRYGDTVMSELTGMTALDRWAKDKGLYERHDSLPATPATSS